MELRALGQLLDVTDVYEKLEKEHGGWLGAAPLYMREPDGHVHHILYGLAGALVIARKDLLAPAGFQKPPETWEELLVQAKKAQQIPRVYGLGTACQQSDRLQYLGADHAELRCAPGR